MGAAASQEPGSLLELRAVAIIPARLLSQRLARKMLLSETGHPLFEHTVRNVAAARVFARIAVATDSDEIARAAKKAGIEAFATRGDHASGTDRIFEAWRVLRAAGEQARVIVNVQGDEPDLAPADLARLVAAFADRDVHMATLAAPIEREEEFASVHVVKVVCDARGDALYFSRAAIPARGHALPASGHALPASGHSPLASGHSPDVESARTIARRHIGVYAFTPTALETFCNLPRGTLEMHENLEQLRWLEAGLKLRVVPALHVPQGIDTAEDYARFVASVRSSKPAVRPPASNESSSSTASEGRRRATDPAASIDMERARA